MASEASRSIAPAFAYICSLLQQAGLAHEEELALIRTVAAKNSSAFSQEPNFLDRFISIFTSSDEEQASQAFENIFLRALKTFRPPPSHVDKPSDVFGSIIGMPTAMNDSFEMPSISDQQRSPGLLKYLFNEIEADKVVSDLKNPKILKAFFEASEQITNTYNNSPKHKGETVMMVARITYYKDHLSLIKRQGYLKESFDTNNFIELLILSNSIKHP